MTSPRATVHATAASPHGASDPHQEGPADLRLVAPALAAWAAAAIGLGVPGGGVAVACGVAVVLAAFALRGRWFGAGPSVHQGWGSRPVLLRVLLL
ncbi:hypothetical protein Srufu_052510 [Streptomyces libani subsp. rufus]|nr:hypothetical protein Srufu_052510 [Streptomyces libani subsp. rufus]